MSRTRLVRVLFFLVILLYPVLVYFGIRYLPVSFFAVFLALLLLARSTLLSPAEKNLMRPLLLLHLAFALVTAVSGSQRLLLLYPALVNFSLCAVFALSLRQDEPILLRLVRMRGIPFSEHAPRYLFWLTAVWAGFFLLSGVAAVVTGLISMDAWVLYNGLIAYVLVAVLMAAEWLFRGWYKRRKGV